MRMFSALCLVYNHLERVQTAWPFPAADSGAWGADGSVCVLVAFAAGTSTLPKSETLVHAHL